YLSPLAARLHRALFHSDPVARLSPPRTLAGLAGIPATRAAIRSRPQHHLFIVVDLNLHRQEYKTVGQQQAEPAPTTASRFDPRRIYTVLVLAPLVYAIIRYLPPLAFSEIGRASCRESV